MYWSSADAGSATGYAKTFIFKDFLACSAKAVYKFVYKFINGRFSKGGCIIGAVQHVLPAHSMKALGHWQRHRAMGERIARRATWLSAVGHLAAEQVIKMAGNRRA